MLKFSIFFFFEEQKFVKENIDIFESIIFVEMKISKLIIHSTDMCQSYWGIKIQCQTPKHNSNQYKAHTLQKE